MGDGELRARRVVVMPGASTALPHVPGLEDLDYLHAGNWLDGTELPGHLIVLGGGYIALEMAQFYRRMGSRVTVLGRNAQVLPGEDADVARAIQARLEDEGVVFFLGADVRRAVGSPGEVHVTFGDALGALHTLVGSHLFVAVGRLPNTLNLGLETLGVDTNAQGFITVNERLETTVPGVYAGGDVRGGPMFTHAADDDKLVLLSQLVGDGTRTTAGRVVPYAVFTDPELGRVGLTEREARARGQDVQVATYPMDGNEKALVSRETRGFVKLVADARGGQLLGAAVLGAHGGELVHALLALIVTGAPLAALRDAVFVYPTLSGALQDALLALPAAPTVAEGVT